MVDLTMDGPGCRKLNFGIGPQELSAADFRKGDRVRYSCLGKTEDGVVRSCTNKAVFVVYDQNNTIMKTGDEPYTAQMTHPGDLIKLEE